MAKSRRSAYALPANEIFVQDGLNCSEDYGDIEGLADQIVAAADGTEAPGKIVREMSVFMKDGKYYTSDGHRRVAALKILSERGVNISEIVVPVIMEEKGVSMTQLLLRQVYSNSGKGLTPWEEARVVESLLSEGLKPGEVAAKTGWSAGKVSDRRALLAMTPEERASVESMGVAASTAMQAIRETDSTEEALNVISIASQEAGDESRLPSKADVKAAASKLKSKTPGGPNIKVSRESRNMARTTLLAACVQFDNWDAIPNSELNKILAIFEKYPEGKAPELELTDSTGAEELFSADTGLQRILY